MVRKVLKADIARALGVSDSMVSRYARRGMPTHSIELAGEWCDQNLIPWLRKGARDTRLPPAEARRDGLTPRYSLAEFAELIEAASERIIASIVFECGLDIARAGIVPNAIGCALDDELTARGIESDLWNISGLCMNDPADPEQRARLLRVEALVAQLKAALGADDATPAARATDQ